MIAKLLPISIILSASVLALGCGLNGLWTWVEFVVAVGSLWLLGRWRGWGWMAFVGLASFVGAAAAALWLGVGAGWTLFGVTAALSAWDLDHFAQRLSRVEQTDGTRALERRHLERLLIVDGLGLLLGAVALGIKIEFGFGAALLLGLIAVLGLSQAIGFLRRESD